MIRIAKLEDIPAIVELAQSSPSAAHWTEQQYKSALTGTDPPRYVVVAESGRVVGFLVASGVAGEWELENIVVHPDFRGNGIGAALLECLLSKLKSSGESRIFLEVRESNSVARGLYERFGFRLCGRRPGYYHTPAEDAILYEKNLEISAPEIG